MIGFSIPALSVAHGVHFAVVGVGVVGLAALLGPQLVAGRRAPTVRDEHARRIAALTEQISAMGISANVGVQAARPAARRGVGRISRRDLPIAVVSSAAAAGVHAAVGPAHFRELFVFGLFFAGAALAQMVWSLAMTLRPSRTLLAGALVGNGAVLLLWLVTRTVGLPGLLSQPERFGPWDLSCAAWELVVVLVAGRTLRAGSGVDLRVAGWSEWKPVARVWVLGSASSLLALALLGASA